MNNLKKVGGFEGGGKEDQIASSGQMKYALFII